MGWLYVSRFARFVFDSDRSDKFIYLDIYGRYLGVRGCTDRPVHYVEEGQ